MSDDIKRMGPQHNDPANGIWFTPDGRMRWVANGATFDKTFEGPEARTLAFASGLLDVVRAVADADGAVSPETWGAALALVHSIDGSDTP